MHFFIFSILRPDSTDGVFYIFHLINTLALAYAASEIKKYNIPAQSMRQKKKGGVAEPGSGVENVMIRSWELDNVIIRVPQ